MIATWHNPYNTGCMLATGTAQYCTCPKPVENQTAKRHGSQTFYSLLGKAADIHDEKSHDYASNSDPLGNYRFAGELAKLFVDPTDSGLIGRFGEKLYRLSNLDKSGKTEKNEPVSDTEIDLLVIIGLFVAARQDRRSSNKLPAARYNIEARPFAVPLGWTCANCYKSFDDRHPIILTTNTAQEGLRQYYLCSTTCEAMMREKLDAK